MMPPVICSPYPRGTSQWQTSPTSEQRAIRVTGTTWYTAMPSCMVCQTTLRMLVSSPLSSTLDGLIELTTKLDLRVWAQRRERRRNATNFISSPHHPSSPSVCLTCFWLPLAFYPCQGPGWPSSGKSHSLDLCLCTCCSLETS